MTQPIEGKPRALNLFGGPGGTCLGFKALGIDALGIELDDAACATRAAAGLATRQGDVSRLNPLDFAPVDICAGSPPCPSFSSAGKGDGIADMALIYELADAIALNPSIDVHTAMPDELWRDTRSRLVIEPLRWALLLEPRFLMWEQVPPVLGFWEYCAEILRRKGWNVWTGKVEAERYGVPQTRERAILMADREAAVHPPRPTHQRYVKGEPQRHEVTLEGEILPWVSMAEALGWVEGVEPSPAPTGSGGGTAGGGGIEVFAGVHARRRVLRANAQSNAAVRAADEPAPTITGGHDTGDRVWVMEKTEDRPERKAQGAGNRPRSSAEPAATIDSRADLSKWVPKEEITACGCYIGVVDADGFCACCHAHLDDPDGLYAMQGDGTHSHRDCPSFVPPVSYDRRAQNPDGSPMPPMPPVPTSEPAPTLTANGLAKSTHQWVRDRPSTTVNGDPRISQPGRHDPEESGSQQKDAIRVSEEEALILQSFPADYPVQGTKSQRFLQIGNAVPPLLAEAILTALLPAELRQISEPERAAA